MNFFAYLCALLKGVIYGSTVFFTGKLTESTDVLDVLALRFLLSFIVMWLLKVTRIIKINVGVKNFIKKSERLPNMKYLLLAALFEPVLYMLFETAGIAQTTGVTTAVILSLAPVLTIIVEIVFLKERCSLLQKIFLGCGVFGAIYIAVNTNTTDGNNTVAGILFLVAAILSGSLFGACSRKSSSRFSPFEITYISCMFGALAFNAANIVRHIAAGSILHYFDPYFSLENMIGFVFLSIASTIVATAMNNYAHSRLQMTTTSAFGGVSTIVTIFIGVIFNNEVLEYYHYIGFAFILIRMIGVSSITIYNDKKRRTVDTGGE